MAQTFEAPPTEPARWRPAPELLVVVGCVLALVLLSLPAPTGLQVSVVVIALSLGVGTIAGIVYHVVLHDRLRPLPARWWWHPTALHDRLDTAGQRAVMPWFIVGAAGFVGSLLGCAAFLSAALRL